MPIVCPFPAEKKERPNSLARIRLSDPETQIVLLGLTFVGAVLASLTAVRYEAKMIRRQHAADSLIEWVYEAGALIGDGFEDWYRYMEGGTRDQVRDWGGDERTLRLNHERYMMRLPKSIRGAIQPHTEDLLTMLHVTLTRYSIPALNAAVWTDCPPSNVLKVRGSHGTWLALVINRIVEILEPFAKDGKRPWFSFKKPNRVKKSVDVPSQ